MTEPRRVVCARWRARAVRAVLAAAAVAPVATLAADAGGTRLAPPACRIRLHVIDGVPIGPVAMDVLRAQVERIWGPHGVAFDWRTGPPAAAAVHPGVVVVVPAPVRRGVVAERRSWAAGMTLGVVDVPEPPSPLKVLRVVVAPDALLAQARLNGQPLTNAPRVAQQRLVGQAFGRIAAHELGHYLLASRQHGSRGLMRAGFSIRELQREDLAPFTLDAPTATRLDATWAGVTACGPAPQVASR